MTDQRIVTYRKAAIAMKKGQFSIHLPVEGSDEVAQLGAALSELAKTLDTRFSEIKLLSKITHRINTGLILDEVLNYVFESFHSIIPFDRIGFSLIQEDGKNVSARWARSAALKMEIMKGYTAPLAGSSLAKIIETQQPRILNDLEEYLVQHPGSESTRLIVAEGMRSSLTCPLIATGKAIGFMFFSSMQKETYKNIHVEIFTQIAGELAVIVEKGRLYQDMLELNEYKNNLLGMVAHDLRNPLAVIKSFVGLMRKGSTGPLTEKQKEALNYMQKSTESMLALISDLLDMSAIESGKLVLHTIEVDLVDLLRQWSSFYHMHAESKNISIVFNLYEQSCAVILDPERIMQVFGNLLSNAIKFSQKGTTITVRTRQKKNTIEVAVIDQGPGIPEHERDKLFREFSRLSVKPTAGEQSTGLGLAIAKKIVNAHGGTIECESTVGVGSTFSFSLPLRRTGERVS